MGDFALERLVQHYNADLADGLGNLLSRTIGMIGRYFGGKLPAPDAVEAVDQALIEAGAGLYARIDAALERFAPDEALAAIWELIGVANKYVVEVKPWALAKAGADPRLATTLYNLAETLRLVAYALAPFLPTTAERIAAQLGFTIDTSTPLGEALAWGGYRPGTPIEPGGVLFPKCSVTADERPTTNDE